MNEMMQWHWWDEWMIGSIAMLVFLFIVIIGIFFLIRWIVGMSGSETGESALDILKKRYARGEISKEEFEEKKRDIT